MVHGVCRVWDGATLSSDGPTCASCGRVRPSDRALSRQTVSVSSAAASQSGRTELGKLRPMACTCSWTLLGLPVRTIRGLGPVLRCTRMVPAQESTQEPPTSHPSWGPEHLPLFLPGHPASVPCLLTDSKAEALGVRGWLLPCCLSQAGGWRWYRAGLPHPRPLPTQGKRVWLVPRGEDSPGRRAR